MKNRCTAKKEKGFDLVALKENSACTNTAQALPREQLCVKIKLVKLVR